VTEGREAEWAECPDVLSSSGLMVKELLNDVFQVIVDVVE
jgi:hypothetical protein